MRATDALGVLGLTGEVDPRRLRAAYLSAVKAAHPDRPGGDAERLRTVIEAYETLRSRPAPRPAPPRAAPPCTAPRTLEISPAEAVLGGLRSVVLEGLGEVAARLPAGLRVGDLVAVSGVALTVAISGKDGTTIVGDHLCLTVQIDREMLAGGGRLEISTPGGTLEVRVTRQDVARGLARVAGAGLPARGRHAQGHLFLRLEPRAVTGVETRARLLLRRFTAAWAA